MKKTREDRQNLISRLERKYALKVQMQTQKRRRDIKNSLRFMRGQRMERSETYAESLEGIFRRPWAA